jgi:hypothetical protein
MGRTNDIPAAVIDDLTFAPDIDASGITVEDRDGEVVLAAARSGLRRKQRSPTSPMSTASRTTSRSVTTRTLYSTR